MLVLMVNVKVKPGRRDEFKGIIRVDAESTSSKEEGNLQFNVIQDNDDPNCFFLYEVYRDQAALEAHRTDLAPGEMVDERRPVVVVDPAAEKAGAAGSGSIPGSQLPHMFLEFPLGPFPFDFKFPAQADGLGNLGEKVLDGIHSHRGQHGCAVGLGLLQVGQGSGLVGNDFFVSGGVEHPLGGGGVGDLDLHEPAFPERIFLKGFKSIGKVGVDLDDGA